MHHPLVSIVVPTFARPALLARCLESIANTVDVEHEVICVTVACADTDTVAVADTGTDADAVADTDTDADTVADTDTDAVAVADTDTDAVAVAVADAVADTAAVAHAHATTTIEQPTPEGYVRAANLGLRAARGTYATVLNDDCTLLPHTIANAVRFLEVPAHAGVGQAAFFHDTPVRRNVHAQIDAEGVRYVVCHVRGLCYANFGLARRDLYDRLGYFDERYVTYGADPDFSLKVWHESGLSVAPCPGALVHHAQPCDARTRRRRALQHEDNRKLFEKWGMAAADTAAPGEPARMTG